MSQKTSWDSEKETSARHLCVCLATTSVDQGLSALRIPAILGPDGLAPSQVSCHFTTELVFVVFGRIKVSLTGLWLSVMSAWSLLWIPVSSTGPLSPGVLPLCKAGREWYSVCSASYGWQWNRSSSESPQLALPPFRGGSSLLLP